MKRLRLRVYNYLSPSVHIDYTGRLNCGEYVQAKNSARIAGNNPALT
jgi:hypothetical protein